MCSERVAEEALEGEDSDNSLYDDDPDEELLAEAAAAPRSGGECPYCLLFIFRP